MEFCTAAFCSFLAKISKFAAGVVGRMQAFSSTQFRDFLKKISNFLGS